MAKLYNLARMSTATTGTGTITLGSAVSGYLSFSGAGVSDGEVVAYGIKDGANSEVGTGTYTASGTTLSRTVTKSTNANAAISLSGTAEVYITARAEDLLSMAETQTANTVLAGPTSGGAAAPTFRSLVGIESAAVLISSQSASSSATLDFTGLDSTYIHLFARYSVIPATTTGVEFRVQVGTGASPTWQTASGYYCATQWFNNGTTLGQNQANGTRFNLSDFSNTSNEPGSTGIAGQFNIDDLAAAAVHNVWWESAYMSPSTGNRGRLIGGGVWNSATAITGLRFSFSSGNISSGRISLFGYRMS